MVFDKHRKATIAHAKVISALIEKDFDIFLPLGDHLPFDLIAYKNGRSYRIQSKYSGDGFLNKNTYWYSKNTVNKKQYQPSDFDYYGAYLPDKNIVIFPASKFAGCTIATEIHKSPTPFYWFEDFLDFTDDVSKKKCTDFNLQFQNIVNSNFAPYTIKGEPHLNSRKVERPSKEELEKLVWEMPTTKLSKQYGVSDVAINKWCKAYNISKPPRGYWTKFRTI